MAELPTLTIHTDGASRGNPGAAACAYIIARDAQPPIEVAECLGQMTNNQAEYTALVRALEHALELGAQHNVHIHADSELMVKQMKGEYRVKNEELRDLYQQARQLMSQFQGRVTFQHVRRERNSRADELCNEALDGKRPALPRSRESKPEVKPLPETPPPATSQPQPVLLPTGSTLREQALTCLRRAAASWAKGEPSPSPEEVWQQLFEVLRQHCL